MKVKDLSVIIGVIFIVVMLVIPLPPTMLSFLIMINMSLALLVLLAAMNMRTALDFSIFPSLLLVMTLFRLALNVSTTRAILSGGDAGAVVETFGSFVVGGNILVGLVVFLILVIINFIVITKGSERVAEVAARFTLDAMPGKQMAIDADLNAGLISEQEARKRRSDISREADFYGSMDGASKFVKGDAIAGIITVFINLIFGIIIGMLQMDMSIGEAINRFSMLTVGDGLVSQIPALLMSTATGIIVTRSASEGNLGTDITEQLFAYPKMMYVAGFAIILMGILTPIPLYITVPIGGLLLFGGYMITKGQIDNESETMETEEEIASDELRKPENVVSLLHIDPIEFEFGYGLIPLADTNQGGDLLDRVVVIRRQLAIELGIVIPVVRIRDNIQLEPNEYRIKIKGHEVGKGEILLEHYLAISPGTDDPSITGIDTIEPSFGIPAKWITEDMKTDAEIAGYTVVDPPSVVSTHLTEVLKQYAHDLLGRQETKQLIDHLKESYPIVVEEVTPEPLSIGDVQKVLAKLLKERVSIRNLPVIFETLADFCKLTTDPDVLTEYVRQALAKQITNQYKQDDNTLQVLTLSGKVEKLIADHIQKTEHGNYLALDPQITQNILESMQKHIEQVQMTNQSPIILCSPAIRMYVRDLTERFFSHVPILSYNELDANIEVQSVGVVNVD
ncbi:flagellar biosynthesis protein FlhA [Pallidibacillus thermolactis]|uniref:flagellar biosynthesis protein FlhA n=1 Tax=Pallidibacillus thermolactis TaxID=251051 RepID=UPI0021D86B1D|nr:flagellar biosynthesis protein FlhA [Pallidibacillus thermolactis]MCU9600742.1 flagellar biosynthesis protein FlhA [Pallidibacillus thermolactis subsp. kokeshiiformis]